MDISDITPQLQQLEKDLDHAQDVLKPFLGDLNVISSKLPLLDKAKFFVLVTYTIESLLFCKCPHIIVSLNSHIYTNAHQPPCASTVSMSKTTPFSPRLPASASTLRRSKSWRSRQPSGRPLSTKKLLRVSSGQIL